MRAENALRPVAGQRGYGTGQPIQKVKAAPRTGSNEVIVELG
jgi:hypothetical protein